MSDSSIARRGALIRTVAALAGDIAVGVAVASACSWLVTSASLGVFLAFLAWLTAALLALYISQRVIHPGVAFLLSDSKLDDTLQAVRRWAPHAQSAAALLRQRWRPA